VEHTQFHPRISALAGTMTPHPRYADWRERPIGAQANAMTASQPRSWHVDHGSVEMAFDGRYPLTAQASIKPRPGPAVERINAHVSGAP
jgi:hypothetical protein